MQLWALHQHRNSPPSGSYQCHSHFRGAYTMSSTRRVDLDRMEVNNAYHKRAWLRLADSKWQRLRDGKASATLACGSCSSGGARKEFKRHVIKYGTMGFGDRCFFAQAPAVSVTTSGKEEYVSRRYWRGWQFLS